MPPRPKHDSEHTYIPTLLMLPKSLRWELMHQAEKAGEPFANYCARLLKEACDRNA